MPSCQVLAVTGSDGTAFTSLLIDVQTGATLSTHKAGWVACPRTLSAVDGGYWAAVEHQSSGTVSCLPSVTPAYLCSLVIRLWPQRKGSSGKEAKIVCPSRVSCMTVAGDLCFVGISEKLHVWQVSLIDADLLVCLSLLLHQLSTGRLFSVTENCFLAISVLRAEGDVLAVGSEDGNVVFWSIKSLSQQPCLTSQVTVAQPIVSFNVHSDAVTGICFGSGNEWASTGLDSRCCVSLASVSRSRSLSLESHGRCTTS